RGGTIGRRVGRKLGWQVYGQDLLEYTAQESNYRPGVFDHLSEAQARWVDERLDALIREQSLTQHPSVVSLARLMLALGSQGEVLLIGRGAGCVLPRATTLNVRIIADLKDRIAYLGQYLRLTQEEAAEQVRLRDQNRADFVSTHFHRQPGDVYQYDLVLNSGLLGEDLCVELIAHAARAKSAAVWGGGGE
ncbi:MAG TPA: cytidylate kinase-like family protein, partial [Gemmataceae bacterium]|nr:cytidylate kinase-like family protein [Gemmataceae bacterium]